MRNLLALLATAICASLLLAGCGSSGSSTSSSSTRLTPTSLKTTPSTNETATINGEINPSTTASTTTATASALTLKLTAKKGYRFNTDKLFAKTGKITINMTNEDPSGMEHNIAIKGHGVSVAGKLVSKGDTSTVTADLEPGTYEFYCVPHESLGMKGILTVTP